MIAFARMRESGKLSLVTLFVGSPGDVAAERKRLDGVVQELNRSLSEHFGVLLDLREWRQVLPDMGRPQAVLFEQLPVERWDVFIGILWLRFGTPSGAHAPNGAAYQSGTEEEFQLAYRAWKELGRPRVLIYRSQRRAPPKQVDAGQLAAVQRFFDQFEAAGAHPGLHASYDSPTEFESLVRQHLTQLVIERSRANETRPQQFSAERHGSGFRNPFVVGNPITRPEDFHGRQRDLRFVCARLATRQSCSIVGDARIGKTSLLHQVLHLVRAEMSELRPVFVDLLAPAGRTLLSLLTDIQRQLGFEKGAATLSEFFEQISDLNGSGVCPLLALDELDLFVRLPGEFSQDFCETLRALASERKLVLLTASRCSLHELHQRGALVSPLYNIMGLRHLSAFDDNEASAFVQRSWPRLRFDLERQREILERARNHPLRLQAYCWHAAQAQHDARADWFAVWQEAETELAAMLPGNGGSERRV